MLNNSQQTKIDITQLKSIYIINQKIFQIFSEYGVLKFGQDNWYCITKNFFKTTTIYFMSNRLIKNCLFYQLMIVNLPFNHFKIN